MYIKENRRKTLLEEFTKKKGMLHKLVSSKKTPIGYLVRCELENEDGSSDVCVLCSFDLYYKYDLESTKKKRDFRHSDLKFFAIEKALKKEKKDEFSCEISSELGKDLALALIDSYSLAWSKKLCFDSSKIFGDKFDETEQTWISNDLRAYISNKIKNISKFYKDKHFKLFLI